MLPERIEKLQQDYGDKYVVVDAGRPELARFKDMVGQVKTVNFNGRALVEFDGNNSRGWYDIELDYLKVVDKPAPKPPPEAKAKPAAKMDRPAAAAEKAAGKPEAPAAEQAKANEKLSPLELARMEKTPGAVEKKPESGDIAAEQNADRNEDRPAEVEDKLDAEQGARESDRK